MLQYVLNRPYMVTAQQRAQAQLDLERNPAWAKKLQLTRVMASHDGCVNSVRWRGDGLLLCSGSDDRCVCVWDRRGALVGKKKTTHAHNIFDAAFVPGSSAIATAAADGRVGLVEAWDGDQPARTLYASRDYGCIASKLSFVPDDPQTFVVAFSDARVRLFDLRSRSHAVVLDLGGVGATAVDFRPRRREIFAVGARVGKG